MKIFLLFLLSTLQASPKIPTDSRITIVMIDTGIDKALIDTKFICKSGIISVIDNPKIHDHGANVFNLIAKNLDPKKHCIMPIIFHRGDSSQDEKQTMDAIYKSLKIILEVKPLYLNLSLSGTKGYVREKRVLEQILKNGTKIAVASGNEKKDLDKKCSAFPACYEPFFNTSNFRVVRDKEGLVGNYGSIVKYKAEGVKVGKPVLTGTSQATANYTGEWVKSETP